MNLHTKYMGLELKNPIIAGASPMTNSLDSVLRLEDSGVAAVVMHSLFEEQINHESMALDHFLYTNNESYAEALDFLPDSGSFNNIDAQQHMDELARIKERVDIPIIASINGVSSGGWVKYVKRFEEAGADGVELNITYIPTELDAQPRDIEQIYIDVVKDVCASCSIPVSVKMNPYFSSPANMAKKFVEVGASALVLFDNPVRVDIDLESLSPMQSANLTDSSRLSESLRWSSILYNKTSASLCASTGVHTYEDVLKSLMSGANAVQMASALLQNTDAHIAKVFRDIEEWMRDKEYESIEQMIGSISLEHTDNPSAYERSSYMQALQSYNI
jgi:dihydroorotate dehydrogenase (fumarate)